VSNTQKSPSPQTAFYAVNQETGINRAIKQMVDALKVNAATYGISWYGAAEHRIDANKNIFPALYQLNSKDWYNALANDQWIGYGFFDLIDPVRFIAPDIEESISKSRYSYIQQDIALVVYGDIQKLLHKQGISASVDYRYNKQLIEAQILKTLQRKIRGVRGTFDLKAVYTQRLQDVFKNYSLIDNTEFIYLPKFGFRFEGELTVTEACNQ